MKISTKAASFLSSIKTQTYDKKEREMIITYQQKRVFHLSLLMLVLCAPIYIYSVPFPNEQFYYGRFYKFNLSLANSQNLIKATANVILLSQI